MVRGMSMQNLVFAASDWRGMGVGAGDVWAAYSLEANMGVTNALQEMVIQSRDDEIYLLPALPQAAASGSAESFLTKAGVEVSLEWNGRKRVASVKLKAKKARTVNVRLPYGASYKVSKNGEKFDTEKALISDLKLAANKTLSFDFRY